MAFPSNPSNNDTHSVDGVTYIYDSTVGVWEVETAQNSDASTLGGVAKSGYMTQPTENEVNINSPVTTSGTWSDSTSTSNWGHPKFNTSYNNSTYNDAPGYREYTIPSGMKTAYMSMLHWSTGGYADVHGVRSDGSLVFFKRINTRQTVENTSHGGDHDGAGIVCLGTGLDHYSKIRITNQEGRIHPTGISFSASDMVDTSGVGLFHPKQNSHPVAFSVARTSGGSVSSSSVMGGWTAITNVGTGFSTSNSRFTAPVAGNYAFHISILTDNSNTTGDTRLWKNGVNTKYAAYAGNNRNSGHMQLNMHPVITLAKNDYVDLRPWSTYTVYGDSNHYHTHWSGYLIV